MILALLGACHRDLEKNSIEPKGQMSPFFEGFFKAGPSGLAVILLQKVDSLLVFLNVLEAKKVSAVFSGNGRGVMVLLLQRGISHSSSSRTHLSNFGLLVIN